MSNDYRVAKRLISEVVVFFDPDEPVGPYGVPIGLNAERVLEVLKDAGFVLFRTDKRNRRAREE